MKVTSMSFMAMLYSLHCYVGENVTSDFKVEPVQEKAVCILWFFETQSVIKMLPRYRTQYGRDPPADNAIRRWLQQFQETGSVLHRKGTGRPITWQEDVDRIQEDWTSYVPRKALMLNFLSILQR
jgi:hypothetical protein